ncbi:MAG: DUF4122 domain-containing protein [Prevotellaceae bacterium]|nr:DUF4122 domain-containing protein [Prevotellaceae bacterium]
MLYALFLLYRIAYPSKQADTKKGGDTAASEKPKPADEVIGKSRFVLPDRSQSLQTPVNLAETETTSEKAFTFAAETEEKTSVVIPENELDEVFANEPNPEIMSIPLENETDDEIDFADEEAEEMGRTLGHEAIMAEGVDYDKLQTAVNVIMEQPNEISEETGETLMKLENADMFELLVSGDEGKMNWIKAVIERHIQSTTPETENREINTDYGDIDVADYLD